MKQQETSRIPLVAEKGMTLYNGTVLGKEVYLGSGDSAENWKQIPEAEAALLEETLL